MFGSKPSRTSTSTSNQRPPSTPSTPSIPRSTPPTPRTPATSPPPPRPTLNSGTSDVDDRKSAKQKSESNPLKTGTLVDLEDPSLNPRDRKPKNPGLKVEIPEIDISRKLPVSLEDKPHVSFEEDITPFPKSRRHPFFQTANDSTHDRDVTGQGPLSTGGRMEDLDDASNEHVRHSFVTGPDKSQSKARFGFTKPLDFWKSNFVNKLKGKCP